MIFNNNLKWFNFNLRIIPNYYINHSILSVPPSTGSKVLPKPKVHGNLLIICKL